MKNNCEHLNENAPELEIEGVVRERFFSAFDCTRKVGNIDFCADVRSKSDADRQSVVWAECKRGQDSLDDALVQLILTVGRARTFEQELPPPFLAAFNAVKIAFIPFESVMDVFSANDFNWNVAPSDHATREFSELRTRVSDVLSSEERVFDFKRDVRELRRFIANLRRKPGARIQITKTNFTHIYYKWREDVKPTIDSIDWEKAKKANIIDADFFLADILSTGNRTDGIYEKLRVLLEDDHYRQRAGVDNLDGELYRDFRFRDKQKAHRQFWNKYRRPPRREYWNYIIERRDLLVPQDVRETKGAFFTPQQWVALSQDYLARELGDNWQERYVVWDCCAGTGNLLAGLNSPRNVWASTLDSADVAVMKQRIANGANLFENHVFQFDFLNDSFDKLPHELRDVIADPERRKKLVVYINPPYAEGDNRVGRGRKVSESNYVTQTHGAAMGYGKRELFVQFLTRINEEIKGCVIGEFSTLKVLQAPKFKEVREHFRATLARHFVVPANTFDNVKGDFPIGFKVWRTDRLRTCDVWPKADVYERDGRLVGEKAIALDDGAKLINDWVTTFGNNDFAKDSFATLLAIANDFQNQGTVRLCQPNKPWNHQFQWQVSAANVIESCIYFAVRLNLEATWLNDRDQFFFPNEGWKYDRTFKGDCLVYALFHGQNRISATEGANHWIPFTEQEVGSRKGFQSHFITDLLAGKNAQTLRQGELAYDNGASAQAARLAYYHAQKLGRTWYDVAAPEMFLKMTPIAIELIDESADRQAVKEVFRRMSPVRNRTDGREVVFPVTAAKKLTRSSEINVFGLAPDLGRLFAASTRVWSETAADIPDHREHRNVTAYHHYIVRISWKGKDLLVRFTLREVACGTGNNEVHGTTVSSVCVYKADGASMSDPGRSQGEALAPFVDNKIALFLSAVNGGKIVLSNAARAVLDAGRELWRYYHAQSGADPDASYYDIRRHFQGVDAKGRMKAKSEDEKYGMILSALRSAMKALAKEIRPKVYDYGFLKKDD